jgi:hypothetical protein
MIATVLTEMLTAHGGCAREGNLYRVPSNTDATIYVVLGQQTLIIDRVVSVEAGAQMVMLRTSRGERYLVAHEDVRAMRFSNSGGSTGFPTT